MIASGLLHWPDGHGWLALSGGNGAAGSVRASVLTHAGPGPIAYLTIDGDQESALRTLEDMESLGAPTGYVVDAARDEPDFAAESLAEAGVIVLVNGPSALDFVRHLEGQLGEAVAAAHEEGAILLAEGAAAVAFGNWVREDAEWLPGLAWLEGVAITTGLDEANDAAVSGELSVHIPVESALALGPAGQLQLWGEGDVRITLGSQFLADE